MKKKSRRRLCFLSHFTLYSWISLNVVNSIFCDVLQYKSAHKNKSYPDIATNLVIVNEIFFLFDIHSHLVTHFFFKHYIFIVQLFYFYIDIFWKNIFWWFILHINKLLIKSLNSTLLYMFSSKHLFLFILIYLIYFCQLTFSCRKWLCRIFHFI